MKAVRYDYTPAGRVPLSVEQMVALEAADAAVAAEEAANGYKRRRAAEMPSIAQQLEALMDAPLDGGAKLAAVRAQIAAVRAQNPKPEADER